MKTTITLKQIAFAMVMALSISACKKDKNGLTPTPPVEVKAITITELKALSTAASVKVPDARTVKGVVISHAAGKNIDGKTVIVQEATGKPGIIVTLDAASTFAAGDELELTVSGQTLAQVNGEVVLQNIPSANVKKTGTGTIAPAETTISAILAAKANFDGTLVKIAATELTGGNGKYTGTLNIKDATGTLTSIVLPAATFSETEYPASVSSITGILRINGDQTRIDIRKTDEVVQGSITKVVTDNFEEILDLQTNTTDAAFIQSVGFKTKAGNQWKDQYGGGILPIKNGPGDESFTTTSRTYIYLSGNSTGKYGDSRDQGLGLKAPVTKGLKSVSITFAMSKMSQVEYLTYGTFPLDIFNPATDYLKIGVMPKLGNASSDIPASFFAGPNGDYDNSKLITYSQEFKEAGKFVTYTWNVPTRDQFIALGASTEDIDQFFERPSFSIYNYSKVTGVNGFNYILFDKIVLNYGN